jgi:hypothetical protein
MEAIQPNQMKTLQEIGKHPNATEQQLISLLRRRIQLDLVYLVKMGLIAEQLPSVPLWKKQMPFRPMSVEKEYRTTNLGQRVIQEATSRRA